MTEEERIEIEKNELNTLINRGMSFDVERVIYRRKKGLFCYLQRKIRIKETLKYTFLEPTLSTLDRISAEQINLAINENVMSSDAGIQEAKKLVQKHSKRLAKILALAVLGQDYVITIQEGSRIRYKNDDKKLEELTELFYVNIKPSKLMQLVLLINTISNLGDFINSIRLMSAARTTMPILIEESKKD